MAIVMNAFMSPPVSATPSSSTTTASTAPSSMMTNPPTPTTSSFTSPLPTKSSSLSLHMPPDVAANANLATQIVPTDAPPWALAHDAAHPQSNGHLEVMGSRTYHDIFHLPNLGGVVRKWLFTRPTMEAISEDSFSNSAVESMTIFRIERIDNALRSLMITPTVSSHYMFIPCQTINGYTVGLAYLDTTYERDTASISDNRVPPLRLGRFVIDDSTGEIFCTAWMDNFMVVAWTQSIIKCERVREFLMFQAPPDGTPPRDLLLRNSFFERRSCSLCGLGNSIVNLPPPCSGVDNRRLSQDPTQSPNTLTNIASIYRRFRGSYCGVALKTKYGADKQPESQQLVPIFVELKHGLHTVKLGFKNSLRKNIDIVLGAGSNDGYFGVNPRTAARSSLLLLKASNPIVSDNIDLNEDSSEINNAVKGRNQLQKRRRSTSPASSTIREGSVMSADAEEHENQEGGYHEDDRSINNNISRGGIDSIARRKRSEDPLQRDSIMHKRKVRNRISAQKSNKLRKVMLEQKKADLEELKTRLPKLQQRYEQLQRENAELKQLKLRIFGHDLVGINDNEEQYPDMSNMNNDNNDNNINNNNKDINNNINNNISFDNASNSFSGKIDFNMDGSSQIQMDWIEEFKTENAIVVNNLNSHAFE